MYLLPPAISQAQLRALRTTKPHGRLAAVYNHVNIHARKS
jgi:hypothetical protein